MKVVLVEAFMHCVEGRILPSGYECFGPDFKSRFRLLKSRIAWYQHVRGAIVLVRGGSLVRGPDLHKRGKAQQA